MPNQPTMLTVGTNIRRLRADRRMSLSELARRSDIAKATLSALEAGSGNPTVHTLTRIAEALGVAFGDLLDPQSPQLLRAANATLIEDPTSSGRRLFRLSGATGDIYDITFHEGATHYSSFHGQGQWEHVYVVSGTLQVTINDQTELLTPGDIIRYPLDPGAELTAIGGHAQTILAIEFQPGEASPIRPQGS